mmetsp:Transcript_20643/g.50784  ORF Transcript_20643/g.50784 Transcript_20643/m.50784 type:complete len:114 (+) Transcript_20643:1170-1511(+)
MIRSGKLLIRKGAIDHFTPEGVILKTDDSTIGCDLVVYGTGFVKSYDVFHEAARTKLALEKDGLCTLRPRCNVRDRRGSTYMWTYSLDPPLRSRANHRRSGLLSSTGQSVLAS